MNLDAIFQNGRQVQVINAMNILTDILSISSNSSVFCFSCYILTLFSLCLNLTANNMFYLL